MIAIVDYAAGNIRSVANGRPGGSSCPVSATRAAPWTACAKKGSFPSSAPCAVPCSVSASGSRCSAAIPRKDPWKASAYSMRM